MYKILVDTDVLIDFSKGKSLFLKHLLLLQNKGKADLFITPVNITEFLNDELLVDEGKFEEAGEFLGNFKTLVISKQIGVLAGKCLREKETSYIADALVAASCVEKKLVLATRNIKHFQRITNLKFFDEENSQFN